MKMKVLQSLCCLFAAVMVISASSPPSETPAWSARILQISRNHQCSHESAVEDLLKFPLASTGEAFGLARRFQPFRQPGLERARLHAVTQPRATLSVGLYLLRWCQQGALCGILHHLGKGNVYGLLVQLTHSGDVIVQARLTAGGDRAFRAGVVLPVRKWIRLDCSMQDSKVLLEATWDNETRRREYEFQDSIHHDDTDGYFVFGGSRFMSGIHGFFGPIRFYRLGTKEVKTYLEPLSEQLGQTLQECEDMKALTRAFLQEVRESQVNTADVCPSVGWWSAERGCSQSWEDLMKHRALFQFLQTQQDAIGTGSLGVKQLRSLLFEEALVSIFSEDRNEITSESSSKSSSFLRASSCFGNHRASLLQAALLLSGLGNPVHQTQGQVYSLIGAAGDNRFALMHAGYKHSQGIDGFPRDLEAAYSYYSNAGAQSSVDRERMHRQLEQHAVEHVYLRPVEGLHGLSHQSTDLFQFVKYQAESGDVDSQRLLGTMLFWGQHGVTRDLQSAVKWLERSALQGGDPAAMYDYSILLMKGQGVRRNHSRGVKLLERAVERGSVSALNGLGWYYGMVLQDHRKALSFFQQAALNGSEEAMFNLGVYHLSGKNPDQLHRNETAAFLLFLNASRLGHAAASVEASWFLSTGGAGRRDLEGAVILLKKVCEQNGHLGFLIRDALQAFLRDDKKEAFLKFLLAAETGLGSAQSNTAHLCEGLQLGAECQWRYNNLSVVNYDPHPSALLTMGDLLLSSSSVGGADSALLMYGQAAAAGSPQAMFNLLVLIRQGLVLPQGVLSLMNLTQRGVQLDLLHRCVQVEDEGSLTACRLELIRVQLISACRTMFDSSVQRLLTYASLLSLLFIIIILPLQSCLKHRVCAKRTSHIHHLNREQSIMGGLLLRLLQACDVCVTLCGVCVCVFCTALLSHLL